MEKAINRIELSEIQLNEIQKIELELLLEVDAICKRHNINYILAYGTLLGCVRHKGFIPWDDDIDICMLREDFERFREVCKLELNKKYFYQNHNTDPEYYYLWDKIRINDSIFKETFIASYNIHHGMFIDIIPVDFIPEDYALFKKQYRKFSFFKTGLMVKYIDVSARKGKKKMAARLLRIIYIPFSLSFLYKNAIKCQTRFRDVNTKRVCNFSSSYGMQDNFTIGFFNEIKEGQFEQYKFLIPCEAELMLEQIYGNYMQLPPINKQKTVHDLLELKFPSADVDASEK